MPGSSGAVAESADEAGVAVAGLAGRSWARPLSSGPCPFPLVDAPGASPDGRLESGTTSADSGGASPSGRRRVRRPRSFDKALDDELIRSLFGHSVLPNEVRQKENLARYYAEPIPWNQSTLRGPNCAAEL